MKLSAIIIAKNAQDSIKRAVQSASFADERIIIVDAASSDDTARLAAQAGATIFTRPWPGYGPQKNFAARQAQGEWLLFIDADEAVTPALRQQILDTLKHPIKDFYWLRIVTIFLGKPLNHLYGHNPRLFKKSSGCWTDAKVHEQVQTHSGQLIKLGDNQSAVITKPLQHHSHPTIKSYLKKMHYYTSLDAEQMHRTGRHRTGKKVTPSPLLPYRLAGKQFLKLCFYRRGFLDGYAGFIWCLLSAYYEFEMSQKYLAL